MEIPRLYGKNEYSIHEVMKNKEKFSFYHFLRIRLKRQNPLLFMCTRERGSTLNVQCSVQHTLLLLM